MSLQQNDNKHYGAEDFERYHSGKMTEKEMHAMEKAALDDPFLYDALEGYIYTTTPVSDISELKNKLLQKKGDSKVVWFRRKPTAMLLKIAAVLILFGGFSWLLLKNNSSKKNEIAAISDNSKGKEIPASDVNKTADTVTLKQEKDLPAITYEWATTEQKPPTPGKDKSNKLAEKKGATIVSGETNYTLSRATATAITDSLNSGTANYYANADQVQNNNVDKTLIPGFRDMTTKPAKNRNQNVNNALAGKVAGAQVRTVGTIAPGMVTLKGKVTDSKGNPVAFATVVDEKNKQGVSADGKGTFAFTTNDSAPKVAVNASGYKTVTKELSNDSTANDVVMLEANNQQKEEIVTSAFGTKRTQRSVSAPVLSKSASGDERTLRVTVTNAIPVNGWQGFNAYVDTGLKTLQQLAPAAVSTEVLVSFNVNDKGEPVDITVKKSLCHACDKEAIRIIKNGPVWKLNDKAKKAIAVVRF